MPVYLSDIGATRMQTAAAMALFGHGREQRTHRVAALSMGLPRSTFSNRIRAFRSHLTPDQRANFDRALSRAKRRTRPIPYTETAARA